MRFVRKAAPNDRVRLARHATTAIEKDCYHFDEMANYIRVVCLGDVLNHGSLKVRMLLLGPPSNRITNRIDQQEKSSNTPQALTTGSSSGSPDRNSLLLRLQASSIHASMAVSCIFSER